MTTKISRSKINSEVLRRIQSDCLVKPTPKFVPPALRGKIQPPDPAAVFWISPSWVWLPVYYSRQLFREPCNFELPHRETSFQFTGTLIVDEEKNQVEVREEAMVSLEELGSVFLQLPPGWGKTVLSAALAAELQYMTVVFVHRNNLMVSWENTFRNNTTATVWVTDTKPPSSPPDVIIAMITSVSRIPEEWLGLVGTLLVDESPHLCTPSCLSSFFAIQPRYVVAMSATPGRPDGLDKAMDLIVGPEKIFRKLAVKFSVRRVMTGLEFATIMQRDGKTRDYGKIIQKVLGSEARNELILRKVEGCLRDGSKIIVLSNLRKHVYRLHELMVSRGWNAEFLCGTKPRVQDSQILIGSIPKIGTGFDQRNASLNFDGICANVLFMVGYTKVDSTLFQTAGRVFRASRAEVLYFTDTNELLERHWKKAEKWFVSSGGTVTEET